MPLDLSKLAATGMRIGFGLVGGSLEQVTLHLSRAGGVYDPAADTIPPAGDALNAAVGVLAFKRKNQGPANTLIVERKFTTDTETLMVQHADLVAAGLPSTTVITEEDAVTRADGQEWAILLVQPIPSGTPAAWLLDVRR